MAFLSHLVMAQPLPSSCFYELSIHRGEIFQPEALPHHVSVSIGEKSMSSTVDSGELELGRS